MKASTQMAKSPFVSYYGYTAECTFTSGTFSVLSLETIRSKGKDNAIDGYEGDHIYRLVTNTGRLIRASSVQFAAEERGLEDVGAAEPLAKRQHISTLPINLVPDLWGDDEIIQDTLGPEREPSPRQAHMPVPVPASALVREPRPRIAKATTYHPLERALPAVIEEPHFIALIANADSSDLYEPRTYRQAVSGGDAKHWEKSMEDEVNSLTENHTWDLVDRPKDRAVLTGKWVYKHKRGSNGGILRQKSRWVVRGFEQREVLDYHAIFASVVKPMSYKLLFAIAAANDLEIEQMDGKTAFLYGDIDTECLVSLTTWLGFVALDSPNSESYISQLSILESAV